ncbi:hypothetical protein N692_03540 [Lactiplantibacillus plantarum EGD-AQ4]|nr:hypothetical protein [Lactiplantibacillus pentosus]EQM54351.1 hypothetical protein N692_03540 [Lactiplantibacillus plantarum EGD-AQ4]
MFEFLEELIDLIGGLIDFIKYGILALVGFAVAAFFISMIIGVFTMN